MSLEKKKWLSIRLGVSVITNAISEIEDILTAYTKQLPDWRVRIRLDQRNTDNTFFHVELIPNDNATISPKQLLAVQDQLLSCAHDLCKQLASRARIKTFHDPFSGLEREDMSKKQLQGYWCLAFKTRRVPYTNVLTITFDTTKRIAFDKKNPTISKKLFEETIPELVAGYKLYPTWIQRLWNGKEYEKALTRSRIRLNEWFNIDYDKLHKQ